jgi:Protein of unknown function (DUF3712)
MDTITQAILNYSKLEVDLIRITKATPTAFIMSIESRVTNTGPLGATMSAMTVEMVGPKGVFGHLEFPEIKTSSKGATVSIDDQKIEIVDMEAYLAFSKSIQLDEKLTLRLQNGKGTIKSFGLKANIVYNKEVSMLGMNGPKTEIIKTEIVADGGFKNTMKVTNPSPLEIDLGAPTFAYKNAAGETLAVQTGAIFINRGETMFTVTGEVKSKGSLDKLSLIGQSVEQDSWISETIKFYDVPISLTSELRDLVEA